jgi:hypothetical protein
MAREVLCDARRVIPSVAEDSKSVWNDWGFQKKLNGTMKSQLFMAGGLRLMIGKKGVH